jgi:hypothetical protein
MPAPNSGAAFFFVHEFQTHDSAKLATLLERSVI